jgi:HEAT repeat protein
MLTSTVKDTKHVETCIQALAALGTMGANDRAAGLITGAFKDPERDIRTAAILAAAQSKNPALLRYVRVALDDPEPEVAFAAATALWKVHDHSGEDILVAVASGERRANATLMNGARHSAARDLHNPATMAKLGATQGAYFLLGPFGFGLSAVEYARKNGGDSARATSIDLLAEQHTADVHKELVDALSDKDPAVRAAAAKGLGQWSDPATATALAALLDDPKLPVRLTGAAAYLRSSSTRRSASASAKPKAS